MGTPGYFSRAAATPPRTFRLRIMPGKKQVGDANEGGHPPALHEIGKGIFHGRIAVVGLGNVDSIPGAELPLGHASKVLEPEAVVVLGLGAGLYDQHTHGPVAFRSESGRTVQIANAVDHQVCQPGVRPQAFRQRQVYLRGPFPDLVEDFLQFVGGVFPVAEQVGHYDNIVQSTAC